MDWKDIVMMLEAVNGSRPQIHFWRFHPGDEEPNWSLRTNIDRIHLENKSREHVHGYARTPEEAAEHAWRIATEERPLLECNYMVNGLITEYWRWNGEAFVKIEELDNWIKEHLPEPLPKFISWR